MEQIPEEYKMIYKTFINQIRRRFLRRQNNNPASIEKDSDHSTPQRTPGNQQNVRCSKAILVAETNKGDTKQMRRMHPLQKGRTTGDSTGVLL